jgi:hypothetical protein
MVRSKRKARSCTAAGRWKNSLPARPAIPGKDSIPVRMKTCVEPGRVHLDPLGNLHICQGIVIGNLFEKPLKQICEEYDVDSHPICGLLLAGGPAALVTEYNLPHASSYADACHLCYEARTALRARFPELLKPDQMYGVGL